jgi:hypothetical protein
MSSQDITISPSSDSYNNIYPDITGLILPKNSLLKDIKINKVIQFILTELQKIPDIQKFKNDLELICMAINLVENLIKKKDKIDKKMIIFQVFQKIFSLTSDDQKILSDSIEFLISNDKVKKISKFSKYSKYTIDFVKKKLL